MRLGRFLWALVPVAYFGLQWFVASAWPVPYDLLHHTISDLGWTTCTVEQRPSGMLESCSPRHAWFNVGGVVLWILLAIGATLLARALPRPRAIVVLWWVVAAFGVATCLIPGDVDINAHSLLAVPIFLGTIAVLVVSAFAWRTVSRPIAVTAAAAAVVSLAGFVGLVAALAGFGPIGLFERLAGETVYLWIFLVALLGPSSRG